MQYTSQTQADSVSYSNPLSGLEEDVICSWGLDKVIGAWAQTSKPFTPYTQITPNTPNTQRTVYILKLD